MATTVLKNTGADLPPAEVQGLLASWKSARQNRSTAYLTSTLEAQILIDAGYSDYLEPIA